jgi:DNA helicase HerA-like ATPase
MISILRSVVCDSSSNAIGHVLGVTGAHCTVELDQEEKSRSQRATVGQFVGLTTGSAIIVGLITAVNKQSSTNLEQPAHTTAQLDLVGEIRSDGSSSARFARGVTEYPMIGDEALLLDQRGLRLIYDTASGACERIGDLHQNPEIGVSIDLDMLLDRHFALLGATGVGKSSGLAIILQKLLKARPHVRIFLIDPHNEYTHCFGDKAQVLDPRNLRLPFWLFNFEEIVNVLFGDRNRNIVDELEILAEIIPLAKAAYQQYQTGFQQSITKRRSPVDPGFTADTPVPYRIEDLVMLLDERMGKLENHAMRGVYFRLISRIQTFRNDPRLSFMFDQANVGGDTMAGILSNLFRLPPNGKPMTVMQLAGFPAEVIDAVVSVLGRMAFDFGIWSDGISPLLFVCEEAHHYAPADNKIGFGPTRRAIARIAKEGRKCGVYLGVVTQRPAEIDASIISQCSTLFCMRLSNETDQNMIRSAVSDAAASLLLFLPSLGTREVFAFGPGVAMPTRLRFSELSREFLPSSEVGAYADADRGLSLEGDVLKSVIERWRGSTMSRRPEKSFLGIPPDQMRLEPALSPSKALAGAP